MVEVKRNDFLVCSGGGPFHKGGQIDVLQSLLRTRQPPPEEGGMSATYVLAAHKAKLPPTQKRVLLALCEVRTKVGVCDLRQRALARACSLSLGEVNRCVKALAERSYLRIEPHPHRRGNLYRINGLRHWNLSASSASSLFRIFPTCSLVHRMPAGSMSAPASKRRAVSAGVKR